MWQLLAIVLGGILLFYWLAFMGTIWFWFNAIFALIKGHFIRAAIWFCLGFGMLAWWQGSDVIPDPWDFDKWLRGSATLVGIVIVFVVLVKFGRWRKKQQAMQAAPTMPVWKPLSEAVGHIAPIIEVQYKRLSN